MTDNETPDAKAETEKAPEESTEQAAPEARAFSTFPLDADILKGIEDLGFSHATPVQSASIEPGVAGKDMIVRAKTGTGKTAAFSIPVVQRVDQNAMSPQALMLAPTRELAKQTAEACKTLTKYQMSEIALLVGGDSIDPQQRALKAGANIVVGTPGRVLDHIKRGNLDPSSVKILVLDEADEMLSMGFYKDVTTIMDQTASDRQVLLFSATINDDTQSLVERYLKDPEEIVLSTDTDRVEGITHILYEAQAGTHKVRSLLYIIDSEDPHSAIIFCNTRENAATVASFLNKQGLNARLLSGELPQRRRDSVMKAIRGGEVKFLVATDVASRGIDISDLSHVINYSLPSDPDVYLHRTGRTGRIGKKGTAISLMNATAIGTRKTLTNKHEIPFIVKELPSPEEATKMRVERQAEQLKTAMGRMVFESYLPTVKAILDREDGHALLAVALKSFFEELHRDKSSDSSDSDSQHGQQNRQRNNNRDGRNNKPRREAKGGNSRNDRSRHHDKPGKSSKPRRDEPSANEGRAPEKSAALPDDLDSLLSFD